MSTKEELQKLSMLELHDEMSIKSDKFHCTIKKVPGGFIYLFAAGSDTLTSQFIPYEHSSNTGII